jgi:DNA modification methylase
MNPYYKDGNVTIYHGDCMEILPAINNIDMVFTSPPYNLGTTNGGRSGMHAGSLSAKSLSGGYEDYGDAMPQDEYNAWQCEVVDALWETLSDNGAIFYNHKPRVQGGTVVLPTMYGQKLPLRQIITWDRGIGMNFSTSFFLPKSEWILIWAKRDWRLTSKSDSIIGDVWHISPEMGNTNHPAPFPIALPLTAIGATSAETVLDPFAGSGTTLRAAKDLGRKAIGIELSEKYCEIAATRLSQEVLFN